MVKNPRKDCHINEPGLYWNIFRIRNEIVDIAATWRLITLFQFRKASLLVTSLKRRHKELQKTILEAVPIAAGATGNDSIDDVTLIFPERDRDEIVFFTTWADKVALDQFFSHTRFAAKVIVKGVEIVTSISRPDLASGNLGLLAFRWSRHSKEGERNTSKKTQ